MVTGKKVTETYILTGSVMFYLQVSPGDKELLIPSCEGQSVTPE
jgi:hypothetical protein